MKGWAHFAKEAMNLRISNHLLKEAIRTPYVENISFC